MSLDPLLSAPPVVQVHAFLAFGVIALTIVIFSLRKGSRYHHVLGWVWVISMGMVAVSSFWINDFRWVGAFGPVHLLSILVLYSLVSGVRAARRHQVKAHRDTMRSLVFGALILAGAFTVLPDRIMYLVLAGG